MLEDLLDNKIVLSIYVIYDKSPYRKASYDNYILLTKIVVYVSVLYNNKDV